MNKFEKGYFDNVYGQEYIKRNTPAKLAAFLNEILHYKNQGKLLDFGCAYGLFIKNAKKYFKCEGLDVSNYAAKIAQNELGRTVKIYNKEITKVNFSEKFDVVTCFDVLEHLPNLDKSLEKIKSILKSDGIIVITVPVYGGFIGKLVEFADRDPTHIHKMHRSWWVNKLEKKGFKIVSYKGVFRYFLLRKYYINWISSQITKFSPAVYIIAKK